VILESGPQKILYHSRLYYPLLAQHPNLRLELHNLVGYLGVEDLAARCGARCLIFGSGLPVLDPNAALMLVTHARLSLEEKRLIARENLAELWAGVRQP
jgi:predicted TIM-barrel fold metal-dependent hydrolase